MISASRTLRQEAALPSGGAVLMGRPDKPGDDDRLEMRAGLLRPPCLAECPPQFEGMAWLVSQGAAAAPCGDGVVSREVV